MPDRIGFDALVLRGVLEEAQPLVGARIDRVRSFGEFGVVLHTQAGTLLISCDPREPRAYLCGLRGDVADGFGKVLKERIEGAIIERIDQVGFDRRFRLTAKGYELAVDLIGTRANMRLHGGGGGVARLRKVTAPSGDGPLSLEAALESGTGLSRTMKGEVAAVGTETFLERASNVEPVFYPGEGAYPMPLEGRKGMPMASLSQALEKYYTDLIPRLDAEAAARAMRGQLERAVSGREVTLGQIEDVLDTASRARRLQMFGELILAHLPKEVAVLETVDYEGVPVEIALDAKKTAPENADRYFKKAKNAKNAAADLVPKRDRLRDEILLAKSLLSRLEDDASAAIEEAKKSGLLREQKAPSERKESPFQGHKVRETEIDGFTVIWGETATANDFVTTRIAKPNDYWLHVRGAHGAHVVLRTNNKPERVPQPTLLKAAVIAAKHSNQKHARHVPVTVTLGKHVRKPRKAAPGAVTFTNDKTLFVDP
ncbi:MAG: NFACT RNA binding domain-containing protein [Fimbriimonadales bacterium]